MAEEVSQRSKLSPTYDNEGGDGNDSNVHVVEVDVANPGNPVFSCDKRLTKSASAAVTSPRTKEPLSTQQHPMYVTSSCSYGGMHPTLQTTPQSFHGKSQKFSEHLGLCGMYRNHSLNTAIDHSRV